MASGSLNMRAMQSALETIHEYYQAFSTLDVRAIVSYFCEPSMTIGPQGVSSAGTHAVLADSLAALVDGLRAKGYGRSEFVEAHVTTIGESAALVRGVAVRYKAAGSELERVPLSYLMHRGAGGWKIAVLVVAN
jgi:ketosteroid isomerase-like protein